MTCWNLATMPSRSAFQVWLAGEELILKSADAPGIRLSAASMPALPTATTAGRKWRVFTTWDQTHSVLIEVAEEHAVRERIAARVAFNALLPLGIALPLLGHPDLVERQPRTAPAGSSWRATGYEAGTGPGAAGCRRYPVRSGAAGKADQRAVHTHPAQHRQASDVLQPMPHMSCANRWRRFVPRRKWRAALPMQRCATMHSTR